MDFYDVLRTRTIGGASATSSRANAATENDPNHPQRNFLGKARPFLWHLIQMVLVMEAGMVIYAILKGALLASTGYAELTREHRLFGYWMMVAAMVLGMIAFMRYRGSTWRHCLQMTLAMLAPVGALSVLVGFGALRIKALHWMGDPTMILAMAIYMLWRPGRHTHNEHGHMAKRTANFGGTAQPPVKPSFGESQARLDPKSAAPRTEPSEVSLVITGMTCGAA